MVTNAYESGAQKMIPAVLVYLEFEDKWLMLHRSNRSGDIHSGKWNGLGGKIEKGESALLAAQRELREESGVELGLGSFVPMGSIHFPNFKANKNEDWMVFLFLAKASKEVADKDFHFLEEGQCHWIEKSKILQLPLWPGDQLFLPFLLEGRKVNGCIWYKDGEVEESWIDEL